MRDRSSGSRRLSCSVNGVGERFIRTLQENFLWVCTFDTIEELRRGLQDFAAH